MRDIEAHIVHSLGLHPNRSNGRRCNLRDSICHSDMICHCLSLGSSLNQSHLVCDRCSLRLQDSLCLEFESGYEKVEGPCIELYFINDLCADPDTCIGRRLNNGTQFSASDKVRLSLFKGLGSGICLCVGLCVNVRLGLGLGGSESVLHCLGLVDDLGRHPNSGRRHDLNGREDGSLGYFLDAGDEHGGGLMHRDGGWYGLGLDS